MRKNLFNKQSSTFCKAVVKKAYKLADVVLNLVFQKLKI